uniref:hypothetical protein n=1 Tax=Comamonas sp. 7D-2 TaxID=1232667 RepID=UPI0002D14654|nr:hypothetical protein [Comamonas sp. 7D-2]AGJ70619.1 hypothetical protein [Comamonas sp. 7D-2]
MNVGGKQVAGHSHRWAKVMGRLTMVMAMGGLLSMAAAGASAQDTAWPVKPIRIVVGFPPGGGPDVMVRSLVPGLSEALGQPVVIENKSC